MNSRVSFDAVLCDVDGVVRHWGNSMGEIDAEFGLAPGTLASVAFDPVRLTPAVTGVISDEEWRVAIADELARLCGDIRKGHDVVQAWSALTGTVDRTVVTRLQRARDDAKVVLVSNATTRLDKDLAALGVLEMFDDVINSALIGVSKPDEAIYRIAAERSGAAVERCVFVDDALENVIAARQLGMTGVHFTQARDLEDALNGVKVDGHTDSPE